MIVRKAGTPVAVIFDIDRTLADVSALEHMFDDPLHADDPFYTAFHEAAIHAPVVGWVAREVNRSRQQGIAPIAVSARPESARTFTEQWLERVELDMTALFLRPNAWVTWSDVEAKRTMLTQIRHSFDPIYAYEDKPEIASMWESEGIPTTLVLSESLTR